MKYFALPFLPVLLACGLAHAELITSLPDGTVLNAPAVNLHGSGPETLAPGVTWSSTNSNDRGGAVFGYTGIYRFGANGEWQGQPIEAVNDCNGSMTFSFATPVAAVGGLLNYAPGSYGNAPLEIEAFNAAGQLLESYDPVFSGGGEFFGFADANADISSFVVSGSFAALEDLTVVPDPVTAPEPRSSLLLFTGLAGVAMFSLRTRTTG